MAMAAALAAMADGPRMPPLEDVAVNLLWHPQAQFAGYLWAEHRNLGAAQGFALRNTPLEFGVGPVQSVLDGNSLFGVASPAHLLESPCAGELVMLLAIQQDSALVYPVQRASGIASLADLAGRRVGVWPGHEDLELRWMLHRAGLSPDAAIRVPMNDTVGPFLRGEVDCAQMTLYHELHQVIEHGLSEDQLRIFRPAEFGAALIKDGFFTTRRLVEARPGFVQQVVNAVLQGWVEAFARPEDAVAICVASWQGLDESGQRTQLADIRALVACGATLTQGLGYPDPEHMRRAAAALGDLGRPVPAALAARMIDERFWRAAPAALRPR